MEDRIGGQQTMMEDRVADNGEDEFAELGADQKVALGKWFLLNSPPGQVQQVAKDVRAVLMDDQLFNRAASEAFPEYNVKNIISLELPDFSGQGINIVFNDNRPLRRRTILRKGMDLGFIVQVLLSKFGEIDRSHYLDPRTAMVVTVDHVKQVCTTVRPAHDEELPSAYVEEYRISVDAELLKYVDEHFPGGECAVYCTDGKGVEKAGGEIELTAVISNSSYSPKNFRGGCWRSVWRIQIKEEPRTVLLQGKINVNAHYFEEGNVQLESSHDCNESVVLQNAKETGVAVVRAVEHLESAYLANLEDQYANLSDRTFKELRRKLPVTRTLFAWDKALQLSLTREIARELSNKR